MSIKEDVEYIKKELSAEESFMESFFKIEKFYKKYKTVLLGSVAVVVIGGVGISVSNYLTLQNKIKANKAFNILLENPNDKKALETLKSSNQKLYKLTQYMQNNTTKVDVEYFDTLASYAKAIKENNIDKLQSLSTQDKFLLKDFAIFNKALLQAKEKKYNDAKETLKFIDSKSMVAPLVKMLQHFLVTK